MSCHILMSMVIVGVVVCFLNINNKWHDFGFFFYITIYNVKVIK
jgi:hypothetical protein